MMRAALVGVLTLAVCSVASAQASAPPHDVTALAKATQNPVGNIVSVPFQFNFNNGGDFGDETGLTLNFQPVMPFRLTDSWNLIARTIVPINSLPGPEGTRYSGVGDINQQLVLTPATPGKIIWGVGPMLSLPTSTATPTNTGTWAGGLSAVVVAMPGSFVLGALVSQLWPMSDAGGAPETDFFSVQPFINWNFGRGYALGFAPIFSANWDAPEGDQWTVPLGLGITRTTVFSGRPITLGAQYYNNLEHPTGAAGHQLRLVVTLIFPTAPKP